MFSITQSSVVYYCSTLLYWSNTNIKDISIDEMIAKDNIARRLGQAKQVDIVDSKISIDDICKEAFKGIKESGMRM